MSEHVLYLLGPGPRPPFYRLADFLWGDGADVDSDGDSDNPDDTRWTELTLELRNGKEERIDVYPVSHGPLVLRIRSEDAHLLKQAAAFLSEHCGGQLTEDLPFQE